MNDNVKEELKACLRPYYAKQSAPIAPPIWTGEPTTSASATCPICGRAGQVAFVLEDVVGATWGLISDCSCDFGTGGLIGLKGVPAQVRPGSVRPSFRHAQGALDRRWDRMMHLCKAFGSEVFTVSDELMAELEGPNVPSVDWLGGGLCFYSDTLFDLPEFDWWQIGKCWESLCALDGSRVSEFLSMDSEFDNLIAAVDRKTETGVWVCDGHVAQINLSAERALPETDFRRCVGSSADQVQSSG